MKMTAIEIIKDVSNPSLESNNLTVDMLLIHRLAGYMIGEVNFSVAEACVSSLGYILIPTHPKKTSTNYSNPTVHSSKVKCNSTSPYGINKSSIDSEVTCKYCLRSLGFKNTTRE